MPIVYASPCQICGGLYVSGTETLCRECLTGRRMRSRRRPHSRLLCQCSKPAITVILVRVGLPEEGLSTERMALCRECLEIEKETQAWFFH